MLHLGFWSLVGIAMIAPLFFLVCGIVYTTDLVFVLVERYKRSRRKGDHERESDSAGSDSGDARGDSR